MIECNLCPHNCRISEGKKGICGTRINQKGKFFSLVYGMPSATHIDPIEKKPLYHFYPGSMVFSLGTLGCNLSCKGCQNYDISKSPIIGLPKKDPEEIVEMAVDARVPSIAYTYNEPTIFYEYMIDIAKIARRNKIHNVIVSNGFINPEPLKELLKYIDAANIDLKGFTEKFYKEYANASLEPVLKTLKNIRKKDCWLEVTNLLIPGLNDNEKEISMMCEWIEKNLKDTPLHFSRFFPYYNAQDKEVTPHNKLIKAKEIAKKIKYVYIGNLGIQDNTYCHNCNNLLIKRGFNITKEGIIDGKCSSCRIKIPGVFK